MVLREWTRNIKGADDVELGIPRTSPLIYHCTAPESGKINGLVFVIPDFNDDADGAVFKELRKNLAKQYGLLAVTVEYHCYRSRLKDGARLDLNDDEFSALSNLCASHGVALLDRKALIQALKQLPKPYEFEFRIAPNNGDYQNFGVMQALDHLAVLHNLMQEQECDFDRGNILALGVGHGGYLSHLITKFAPNAIRAVFDADSNTFMPKSYLFGEEMGKGAPYYYHLGNIRLFPIIQTRWQSDQASMSGYTEARAQIRDTALASHIGSMAKASLRPSQQHCHYRLLSTSRCTADGVGHKSRQASLLQQFGFDVELLQQPVQEGRMIDDEQPWQNLMKMFDASYPKLPLHDDCQAAWQSSVAYLSGNLLYCFDFDEFGCLTMMVPVEKTNKRLRYY